jgi:hypothetical protein
MDAYWRHRTDEETAKALGMPMKTFISWRKRRKLPGREPESRKLYCGKGHYLFRLLPGKGCRICTRIAERERRQKRRKPRTIAKGQPCSICGKPSKFLPALCQKHHRQRKKAPKRRMWLYRFRTDPLTISNAIALVGKVGYKEGAKISGIPEGSLYNWVRKFGDGPGARKLALTSIHYRIHGKAVDETTGEMERLEAEMKSMLRQADEQISRAERRKRSPP